MVNFKRIRQETGSYCGPAVFEMLVSAHGLDLDQERMVEACNASETVMKEGIPLIGLAKGLNKLFPELIVWQKAYSSLADMEVLVAKGYPVGFDWQGIFTANEYGDEIWSTKDKVGAWWKREIKGEPVENGDQGHYCIAFELDLKKGFLRFADPYGHYAGKDRFVSTWEFEERWWDDRIDQDKKGKKIYVLESRLMFLVAKKGDKFPESLGMEKI